MAAQADASHHLSPEAHVSKPRQTLRCPSISAILSRCELGQCSKHCCLCRRDSGSACLRRRWMPAPPAPMPAASSAGCWRVGADPFVLFAVLKADVGPESVMMRPNLSMHGHSQILHGGSAAQILRESMSVHCGLPFSWQALAAALGWRQWWRGGAAARSPAACCCHTPCRN